MRYTPTARQDSLFGCPYKFIIDACSIISQNPNSTYPRHIYVGLWEAIDDLVNRHEIVTCKQIASEVSSGKNDDISKQWISNSGIVILEEDKLVQEKVKEVVNATPKLLRFKTSHNSSGDPFIIATAMENNLTIVTEENQRSPIKIPQVAEKFGVKSVSINELAQLKGWSFENNACAGKEKLVGTSTA